MRLIRRAQGRRTATDDQLDAYLDMQVSGLKRLGVPHPKGYYYMNMADFVLRAGVRFESKALTAEDKKLVSTACGVWKKAAYGDCYMNAQRLVHLFARDDVKYAEGFAKGEAFIPVMHGWVVLPSGAILDPTWKPTAHGKSDAACGLAGVIPEGWCYRGVLFSHQEVEANMARTQMWASLIDDWKGGWPLLKEPR